MNTGPITVIVAAVVQSTSEIASRCRYVIWPMLEQEVYLYPAHMYYVANISHFFFDMIYDERLSRLLIR